MAQIGRKHHFRDMRSLRYGSSRVTCVHVNGYDCQNNDILQKDGFFIENIYFSISCFVYIALAAL